MRVTAGIAFVKIFAGLGLPGVRAVIELAVGASDWNVNRFCLQLQLQPYLQFKNSSHSLF